MEALDFRRGLMLAVLALSAEELFKDVVAISDLRQLPTEVRHRIVVELGKVDAGFGFGPAEEGSSPN